MPALSTKVTAAELDGFDLRALPARFYDDPYPWYAALREATPVRAMPDGSWLLTRYADIEAVYKDAATFSSDKKQEFQPKYGDSPLYEHHTTSLVFNDDPLHRRVRRLITGALTPRAIDSMAPALTALVDRLLDAMAAKAGRGDAVDLIADFAAAIPVEVIGNLLAVPHDEREPLRDWSLAILGALEPSLTAAQLDAGNRAVQQFVAYLKDLIARRRAAPGDPAVDVLTRLILGEEGQGDQPGEKLTEIELYQNCIFILNAGHETTTNLIGNGLVTLLDWPDEARRLRDDPDALGRTAIEECLRFESSNQLGNRRSTRACRIGDVELPPGSLITMAIGAANRDPAVFPDPDRFDIARSPNRHLAFGSGVHVCAGMSLARLEGRIAIGAFVRRFPRYRLAGIPLRGGRARFRGYLQVPLSLTS